MESPKRSLVKAMSWRLTATFITTVIVWLATGQITLAALASAAANARRTSFIPDAAAVGAEYAAAGPWGCLQPRSARRRSHSRIRDP